MAISEIEQKVKSYVDKVNYLAEQAAEKLRLEELLNSILNEVNVSSLNISRDWWCKRLDEANNLLAFQETLDGLKTELAGLPIPGRNQSPGDLCSFPSI